MRCCFCKQFSTEYGGNAGGRAAHVQRVQPPPSPGDQKCYDIAVFLHFTVEDGTGERISIPGRDRAIIPSPYLRPVPVFALHCAVILATVLSFAASCCFGRNLIAERLLRELAPAAIREQAMQSIYSFVRAYRLFLVWLFGACRKIDPTRTREEP